MDKALLAVAAVILLSGCAKEPKNYGEAQDLICRGEVTWEDIKNSPYIDKSSWMPLLKFQVLHNKAVAGHESSWSAEEKCAATENAERMAQMAKMAASFQRLESDTPRWSYSSSNWRSASIDGEAVQELLRTPPPPPPLTQGKAQKIIDAWFREHPSSLKPFVDQP